MVEMLSRVFSAAAIRLIGTSVPDIATSNVGRTDLAVVSTSMKFRLALICASERWVAHDWNRLGKWVTS